MKNLIDSLGITHRRFAEEFKIPYRTVASWYTGERTAPEWVYSLIVQIIELKAKGEPISIDDRIIFCNVKTASRLDGEYRTYYTDEREADKEIDFYKNKMHGYSFKREIYRKVN